MRAVPERIENVQCDVCGKLCVPMTYGKKRYDEELGFVKVSVCYDCHKRYGEEAYLTAIQNRK